MDPARAWSSHAGQRYSARAAISRRINAVTRGRRTLANVAVLAGGTAVGQLLTVAVSPLLTRLYTPEDLGRLGLYMAFVAVASVATSLRYELAIVSASTAREAAHLAVLSLLLLLPVSGLLALILYAFIQGGYVGFGALPVISCGLVILSLVATGAATILRYWFVRGESFPVVSGMLVRQSVVRSITQVGLGLVGMGWFGLLIGDVLGRMYGVSRLARLSWHRIRSSICPIDPEAFARVFRMHWKYPVFNLPSSVIDTLAVGLSIPLITQLHGMQAAGYFSLVYSVQAVPISFVGASVADVFHARMARYAAENRARSEAFFLRTSAGLCLLGLAPAVLLVGFGPRLFGLVFGEQWTTAGTLAAQMAPWGLATLIVNPVSRVIVIFEAQELKFVYDLVALGGVVGSLMTASALRLDLVNSVRLLSVVQVVGYGVYFAVLLWVVRRAARGSICAA